jgi:hypothetical protein
MTSVGYTNPISASGGKSLYIPGKYPLGGGIPGFIPQSVYNTNNNNEFIETRFSLKQAWNTGYAMNMLNKNTAICTPFRAVNNAGDLLSRKYYSCGGPCQTFQSRPGMFGLKQHFGAIQNHCDGTGVPPSSCNIKYVYDSSDYIRYSKQKAVNKNYNDASYGGNNYSGAQSAIRAIRRY